MSNAQVATGRCQCGAIHFSLRAAPRKVYACHCSECRRQSASAFGISVIMDKDALSLDAGSPKSWSRPTASGGALDCWFCPDCGSRLWHEAREVYSVKGGALDKTPEPASHIWTSSKLSWVILPDGVEVWPEEPDD